MQGRGAFLSLPLWLLVAGVIPAARASTGEGALPAQPQRRQVRVYWGISVDRTLRVGESLRISKAGSEQLPAPDTAPRVHTVRKGETLSTIAARYQTSIDRLCALNDISRRDTLHPGRRLTVSD